MLSMKLLKKKEVESEQNQSEEQQYPTGYSPEYVPPPYALYNGAYTNTK